jgi:hypothetical protein
MNRVDINQARREALFASGLQRSDVLTADALTEGISWTVRRLGIGGCISLMAQEFGDHPEAAAERMRWVRQLADEAFASRAAHRATQGISSRSRSRRAWTGLSPDYDPNAGMNLARSRSKKEQGTGCASSSERDRPGHQVGTTRQMLVGRHEGRRWAPKVSEWRDWASSRTGSHHRGGTP